MKKRIITVALVLLLVLGGWSAFKKFSSRRLPTSGAATIENRVIKSVSLKNADETNFLMGFGQDKEFFKKHNIAVENVVTDGNSSQLMLTGAADIYVGGIGGVLNDFLNGMDLRWIQTTTNHPYNMVGVSRFAKGDESKIKKVAVTRLGGGNHLQVLDALQKLGINKENVEFVVTPIASRAQMMEDGQIDFTVLDADFSGQSDLYQRLEKFTIYSPDEIFSPSVAARGIMTTGKALTEKQGALKDFVAATQETLEYADQHPEEVVAYLQSKFNFSQANAEKFYANYKLARQNVNAAPDAQFISPAAEIMKKEFKVTDPERNLNDFIFDLLKK